MMSFIIRNFATVQPTMANIEKVLVLWWSFKLMSTFQLVGQVVKDGNVTH